MIRSAFLISFGLVLLVLAIRRLRQYKLKERYALMFLLLGLPFFVLAAWPNALGELAERLGVAYGTVALVMVTVFLILMIFELLTIVSKQDRKINVLAQYVGILMEQQKLAPRGVRAGEDGGEGATVGVGGDEDRATPVPELSIFEVELPTPKERVIGRGAAVAGRPRRSSPR